MIQTAPSPIQAPAPPERPIVRLAGLFRGGLRELQVATARRVPFLDALRALAVLLVINEHLATAISRLHGANRYTRFVIARDGWMGVDLFFVLSGYFIGIQLWRELGKTGTISLKQFMIRRGLRIWPLYFFVFALVFALFPAAAAARQYGWTDLVFLTNYLNHGIVQGSWSLCTEEQFYLLTPLVLLLVGRRPMASYRWGLGILLGVVVAVRAITFVALTGHFFGKDLHAFSRLYTPFHTHCDGLIAGLFVANLASTNQRFRGLLGRPWLLVALSFVLMIVLSVVQGDVLEFTGVAILCGSLVWWGISVQTRWFGQHIFYLLSRLSFGMYLNHEYFTRWIAGTLEPALGLNRLGAVPAAAADFLLLCVLSVALSTVTFCLIEHPFLVLRTAMLRRVTPRLVAH